MSISTLTSKGQATIPKKIRDYLNLKPHDKINFIPYGKDKVVLNPVRGTIVDLKGVLHNKAKSGAIDFHKLREHVKTKVTQDIVKEMR